MVIVEQLEGQNVVSDFYDALDEEVAQVLENASRRAEENDRKTVQARGL
jgi:histone H3/H4